MTDYIFKELLKFTTNYVAMNKMKKDQFKRGSDPQICQQLGDHFITTYQELHNRVPDEREGQQFNQTIR